MKIWILLAFASFATPATSQYLEISDKTAQRMLSDDNQISIDTEYKGLYLNEVANKESLLKKNELLQKQLKSLREDKLASGYGIPVRSPEDIGRALVPKKISKKVSTIKSKTFKAASGLKVFAVSNKSSDSSVLPAGSFVKAKLMTGVQANSKYGYNVLLQLDYAYTGPNDTKIPLNGCLMIGGATADLSIERVIISPHTLSCVRASGEHVQREISGFIAGSDSSIGLEGLVDSKQDRVFLAAALAGIVKGASQAYEIANLSQTVGGSEDAKIATNFTGTARELALAKGLGTSAEMVTQWYLEQAKSLLPSINVGSGQDVWIIMADSVNIPRLN